MRFDLSTRVPPMSTVSARDQFTLFHGYLGGVTPDTATGMVPCESDDQYLRAIRIHMSRIDLPFPRQRASDRRLQQLRDAEERAFWRRQIGVAKALNWVTGVGAILSLLTMGILWFTLRDSQIATEEADRAWLAPMDEEMDVTPKVGEDWSVTVHIRNVGKEPALNFKYALDIRTPSGNPDQLESGKIQLPTNDTCARVSPSQDGTVMYTEHEYSQYRLILMGKQDQNAVLSKTTTLVSVGCLGYRTFEKSRVAAFCFYLRPPDPPQHADWHWCLCPKGNTAT